MKSTTLSPIAGLIVALILGASVRADPAIAQEQHQVQISDGIVTVDGQVLSKKMLPPSLDVDNLNASLSFTGKAYFNLNGLVYQIKDGNLAEVNANDLDDSTANFFFVNPVGSGRAFYRAQSESPGARVFFAPDNASSGAVRSYYRALSNKAKEFQNLKVQIDEANSQQTAEVARELQIEAENAARLADALPRLEFEYYLQDLHTNDTELYQQLIREHDMELEARTLALKARQAKDKTARTKAVNLLESRLSEIFQLKQLNRQREIEELSRRLSELKKRLAERSKLQKKIIASRMNELLGTSDW